jgi:hypothetical protein
MSKKKRKKMNRSLSPTDALPPLNIDAQNQAQQEEVLLTHANEECFVWESCLHKKQNVKHLCRYI